ncbi:phosphatase [Aliidongia dinghuensis]|uniref:Phosphatase n=1 Tax=Aliidongia dinghuensis TaxID=1867774 RepID=A0A8J3E2B0_9PROT|nr:phosphatase [Aliidongia dinghuensis]
MTEKPVTQIPERALAAFCRHCGSALAPVADAPNQRRCTSPDCGKVTYDNPIPVVAGIVERDGAILLVRSIGWPAEWFGLVTGFLEPHELPEAGVVREIKEELGLDALACRFVGHYLFKPMNQLIMAYHVEVGPGEVRLDESELEAWKAVPVEKLRPWPFGTGEAVRDFLARRFG